MKSNAYVINICIVAFLVSGQIEMIFFSVTLTLASKGIINCVYCILLFFISCSSLQDDKFCEHAPMHGPVLNGDHTKWRIIKVDIAFLLLLLFLLLFFFCRKNKLKRSARSLESMATRAFTHI